MIHEMIRSLDFTLRFIEDSVSDLSEEEMVRQPDGVPNHAAWTLGHLIYSCQGLAAELGAEPWLPGDWEARFGYGSVPVGDVPHDPGKAELLAMLADSAERLRQVLLAVDESVLVKPLEDIEFPTLGDVLLQVVVGHTAYHAGQLAVWRRAIGKDSAGVFV